MEKVIGPVDGFYIAVYVRDLGQLGTSFLGHYRICQKAPRDFHTADFVRNKCVEGVSNSAEEAQEIAIQLARLQIANFRSKLKATSRVDKESLLQAHAPVTRDYDPTVSVPL